MISALTAKSVHSRRRYFEILENFQSPVHCAWRYLKPRVSEFPQGYTEEKKRIVILRNILYKVFEYANTYKR